MPNWNSTAVIVTGPSKDISDLYNIMCSLEEADKPTIENGFGNRWYGCLVEALGAKWDKVRCRGSWYDVEKYDENTLKWWDETAWGPLTEVFDVIEKHYPDVEIYWQCEEPGMSIYASNDINHKFFNTQFIFYYDEFEQSEYFDSEDELLDFVNDYLKDKSDIKVDKPIKTLEELDKFMEDSDDFCYYKYKYY